MMSISENLSSVIQKLPKGVTLVAVSKTKPISLLLEAYNSGQRIFGENRVQELVQKNMDLPSDIEWHMIGHLQSKKVKLIAPFISMIHSVDSLKLLTVINEQALKHDRIIDVLLQFHIAKEISKFGLTQETANSLLTHETISSMKNIRFRGVMGMATFTDDQSQVRKEFSMLRSIFEKVKIDHFPGNESFNQISMGMSGDYQLAIKEGSTMVRVGSTIFGKRS